MKKCWTLPALFFLLFLTGKAFADEAVSGEATKVLVVMLFDQHCKVWCGQVRPLLKEIQPDYQGRARFVELDTTPSQLAETKKQAKQLGIEGYLPDAMGNVPEVLIFRNTRHGPDMAAEMSGAKPKKAYTEAVDKALSKK